VRVWLFDPNLNYMDGKHITLAIVAAFIIIIGIFFTAVLLFSKCLVARSKSSYFNIFMEAFTVPLKANHQYWVGLLFLTRNLSYLTTQFINAGKNPAIDIHFVFTLTVALLAIKFVLLSVSKISAPASTRVRSVAGYSRFDDLSVSLREAPTMTKSGIVYNNPYIDLLETSFMVNVAVFSYYTLYLRYETGSQPILFYISSSIVLLTFVGILIYHACTYTSIPRLFKNRSKREEEKPECHSSIESYGSNVTSLRTTTSEVGVI
jgi:hypothetical protein